MSFAIRPIRPEEHCLLDEFLCNAIFLPPGVSPPSRDIISKPEISAYIKDFGGAHDRGIGTLMMLYLFELLSRHDYSKTSLRCKKQALQCAFMSGWDMRFCARMLRISSW
ncbi:MAG: N-acetyltransferase [Dehalococcoidia bacterium]|nr:N-acetyltransferase [Dehalococcoidia bacterium]